MSYTPANMGNPYVAPKKKKKKSQLISLTFLLSLLCSFPFSPLYLCLPFLLSLLGLLGEEVKAFLPPPPPPIHTLLAGLIATDLTSFSPQFSFLPLFCSLFSSPLSFSLHSLFLFGGGGWGIGKASSHPQLVGGKIATYIPLLFFSYFLPFISSFPFPSFPSPLSLSLSLSLSLFLRGGGGGQGPLAPLDPRLMGKNINVSIQTFTLFSSKVKTKSTLK